MRTIDREHLELLTRHAPHPAGNIRGLPIRRIRDWVSITRQACLTFWKLAKRSQREPRFVSRSPFPNHGRKKIASDRHAQPHADGAVKKDSELHQHSASRKFVR